MIWRLFVAVVLLVVVVGGIVGFNLFRDQDDRGLLRRHAAAAGHGLGDRGRADHLAAGDRGDRHRAARRAASTSASRPAASCRRSCSAPTTGSRRASVLVQIDDRIEQADLAAAQASLELSQETLERVEALRARGVAPVSDLDVARADATNARADGRQADRGDGAEGARGALRRHHRHPAGRGRRLRRCPARSMRRCRTSTPCGSTSRCPSSRHPLIKIGLPVTASSEVGRHRAARGQVIAIEPKIDPNSRLVMVRAEVENPGGRDQPRPVPARARRAAGGGRA